MAEAKAVVAVNSKGNIAGAYKSISEAARINGFDGSGISHAISRGYTYKKLKWMLESEYRKLWFEGRTSELCYTLHERASNRVRKRWANASEESLKRWRKNMSESAKRKNREHPEVYEKVRIAHCKPVLCITTGEVFESAAACDRAFHVHPNITSQAIRRGYKIWSKYAVKYITKEEYEDAIRNQEKDSRNPA